MQLRLDDLGTPLIDVHFVVVDLETTGVDPERDRITEIGAVRSHRGEVVGELATLVHPGRSVPPAVTSVTGITDAMLVGCPVVEDVLPRLVEFVRGGVFVAHNASFDHRFLHAALARDGREPLGLPVLDTARLARRLLAEEVRSVALSKLARHLGARTSPNHRALPDARATLDVLHALIERASALGATTLEDLLDLQRSTSTKAFKRVDLVRDAPSEPGVYRFVGDRDEVLYVGTTKDLRTRLRRYFGQDNRRKIDDLVKLTRRVEWDVCATAIEAQVLEVRAIHHHRPRFNRRSRHPEKAAWVTRTKEPFPRLTVTSKPPEDRPSLGPLSSRRVAATVVEALQESTGIRPCTPRLRVRQDHPACVLKELGRCASPCDGSQSRAEYDLVVEQLDRTLAGQKVVVLRDLRASMRRLSSSGRFEQAARVRTRIHTLARAMDRSRRLTDLHALPWLVVARPSGRQWEALAVAHGRLVASAVVGDLDDVERWAEDRRPVGPDAPPTLDPLDVEEILLLSSWVEHRDARLVTIDGTWTGHLGTGRAVGEAVAEAKAIDRRLRRDRIDLEGRKVAARPGPSGSGDDRSGDGGTGRELAVG